jgi:transposase
MLKVEDIEAIRRAYHVERRSIRAISREQGHHRRVVREAIAGRQPAPRHYCLSRPRARSVVGPVAPLITAWLEADQAAPRKQRHTAKRIFDRLVAEHGYAGKERAVREYVHDWKQAQGQQGSVFLPLAYAPGAEGQCDWGEARVVIAGVEQTVQLFCLRLCYSLKPFVCAFPTARQECFFAGHAAAFAFLGGVPARITYDNLTSAVAKVLAGHDRLEQDAFVAFRGHYLFGSHFCLPGEGGAHEKPLVESLVGYARRNFLVPIPAVASWEELNDHLLRCCVAEDGRAASNRGGSIGALWAAEQTRLRPLQPHAYACCRTKAVRVSRQALVSFERNRYSVPTRHAGERLLVRAFPWQVEITDGQQVVARHPRLYGREGEQLDPLHYLELLERKPGAFALARPMQQWAPHWPPIYRAYLQALQQARPERATREFVRVLQLHTRYPAAVLARVLEQAITLGCWSADGVEYLAHQTTLPAQDTASPPPSAVPAGFLPEVVIPLPDIARFNALLQGVGS